MCHSYIFTICNYLQKIFIILLLFTSSCLYAMSGHASLREQIVHLDDYIAQDIAEIAAQRKDLSRVTNTPRQTLANRLDREECTLQEYTTRLQKLLYQLPQQTPKITLTMNHQGMKNSRFTRTINHRCALCKKRFARQDCLDRHLASEKHKNKFDTYIKENILL